MDPFLFIDLETNLIERIINTTHSNDYISTFDLSFKSNTWKFILSCMFLSVLIVMVLTLSLLVLNC